MFNFFKKKNKEEVTQTPVANETSSQSNIENLIVETPQNVTNAEVQETVSFPINEGIPTSVEPVNAETTDPFDGIVSEVVDTPLTNPTPTVEEQVTPSVDPLEDVTRVLPIIDEEVINDLKNETVVSEPTSTEEINMDAMTDFLGNLNNQETVTSVETVEPVSEEPVIETNEELAQEPVVQNVEDESSNTDSDLPNKFCPNCGNMEPSENIICSNCGSRI